MPTERKLIHGIFGLYTFSPDIISEAQRRVRIASGPSSVLVQHERLNN